MSQMEKNTFSAPDEKRSFDKGQVELVTLGRVTFGRATLQPAWKWSTCVKPIVNTESCQAPHLQYQVSGRLRVRMDDGSEDEFGPGRIGEQQFFQVPIVGFTSKRAIFPQATYAIGVH
jgi:hypothetical protein